MYFQLYMEMLSHWNHVVAGQSNWLVSIWIWISEKVSPQMFTKHSLNDESCARYNYSKYVYLFPFFFFFIFSQQFSIIKTPICIDEKWKVEEWNWTLSMYVRVLTMVNNSKTIKKQIRCQFEKQMLKETVEENWMNNNNRTNFEKIQEHLCDDGRIKHSNGCSMKKWKIIKIKLQM